MKTPTIEPDWAPKFGNAWNVECVFIICVFNIRGVGWCQPIFSVSTRLDPFVQEWRPKYSPLSYHFVGVPLLLRPHLETLMPCCHVDIGVFPLDLHPGVYGASAERCRKLEKKSGFWIGRQQQDVWHSHFLPWMTDVGHYGKLCSNTIARV